MTTDVATRVSELVEPLLVYPGRLLECRAHRGISRQHEPPFLAASVERDELVTETRHALRGRVEPIEDVDVWQRQIVEDHRSDFPEQRLLIREMVANGRLRDIGGLRDRGDRGCAESVPADQVEGRSRDRDTRRRHLFGASSKVICAGQAVSRLIH